ncbi:phosphotransferase [Dyella jejuensis]|uniref:Phosphotransferase n=1 Tax=Dyella jejuensis TaxID=1432009 RepID=A0ABW8JLI3_9GAMM
MHEALRNSRWTITASTDKYEWIDIGETHVLKLFRDHISSDDVRRESRSSSLVNTIGIPSPSVEPGIYRADDGRQGILFKRASGRPLSEFFRDQPLSIFKLSKIIADAHLQIHAHSAIHGLRSQRDYLAERIATASRLSLGTRKKLMRVLQALPEGDQERVCHTHLFSKNILISGDCITVSDWGAAANGNFLCDVAKTWLMLCYPLDNEPRFSKAVARWYCKARAQVYLRAYAARHPIDFVEFRRWVMINMAATLFEQPQKYAKSIQRKIEVDLKKLA